MPSSPNLLGARKAQKALSQYLKKTPLIYSSELSERLGKKVWLKLETQQPTGSFKVRPALNGMLTHLKKAKKEGVITTSSGNFAQAVAYAAHLLKVKAAIVMTQSTAPFKVERTKSWGAEVVFCEDRFEARFKTVERLQKERGGVLLHGFDSMETIYGDGTLGLELLEDFKKESISVLVPISGGGLISGIASVLKEKNKKHEVIGIQPEKAAAMAKSIEAKQRVNIGPVQTIADALVASMAGERTFGYVQKFVNHIQTVTEEEIIEALKFAYNDQKLVIEAGAAIGIASLLSGKVKPKHKNVVCVISGGNIEVSVLNRLLTQKLS